MQLPPVNMTFRYIRLFGHVSVGDQNVNVLHGLVNVARSTQALNGTNATLKSALVF